MRLLFGLLKGIIIGGAVGFGALSLGWGSWSHWITYGVIGALVGIIAGRPLWSVLKDKNSTIWTVIVKAAFGYGVGVLFYALLGKAWGGPEPFAFELLSQDLEPRPLHDWQPILGAIIGGLYGAFVEVDDAPTKDSSSTSKPASRSRAAGNLQSTKKSKG